MYTNILNEAIKSYRENKYSNAFNLFEKAGKFSDQMIEVYERSLREKLRIDGLAYVHKPAS